MESTFREHVATGSEYLDLATKLLQRARLEDPTAGLWEAGDVQWWWRRDRPSDRAGQTFWLDDAGAPVAAVIFTDWGDTSFHSSVSTWSCDPFVLPSNAEAMLPVVWSRALERIDSLALDTVDVIARDDDTKLQARRLPLTPRSLRVFRRLHRRLLGGGHYAANQFWSAII
jgi:hypothetical protein